MDKMMSMLKVLVAFVLCVVFSSVALAQATRTWVSGVGDDVNPCSRTAPCKTFAGAISKTATGGEISVLDPGGFGAVTITKSITINGDGTLAGILSSLTNGIVVNAAATSVVVIRGISINGASNGTNGIRFLAGKQLIVEDCTIAGFTTNGIEVSLAAAGNLTVRNTSITGLSNGVGSNIGIRVTTTAGTATASLENVRIRGVATGLDVLSNSNVTISRSVVSQNSNFGIVAEGNGIINSEGNILTNNLTGIAAAVAGTTIRLSNCDIFNNTTGVSIAAGATGTSFVNNRILGNGTNISGTLGTQVQQ
jgi:nitrous oxidase accessory protein NosD